ncbi:MAG: hypothetical protein QNJ31_07910 [Candidatus Caenarcaniphilales bacterium]|nr:hypothetical protein [Candidatus Caenarcaniphilales bacterium]
MRYILITQIAILRSSFLISLSIKWLHFALEFALIISSSKPEWLINKSTTGILVCDYRKVWDATFEDFPLETMDK